MIVSDLYSRASSGLQAVLMWLLELSPAQGSGTAHQTRQVTGKALTEGFVSERVLFLKPCEYCKVEL